MTVDILALLKQNITVSQIQKGYACHCPNYLPSNVSDQDYPPSCTASGCILHLCKSS